MKRIVCIGVLALFAIMLISALSAGATWNTDRRAIRIESFDAEEIDPEFSIINNTVIREQDIGTPTVGRFWSVNNSITVINSFETNITNLTLNFTYWSHARTQPVMNVTIPLIENNTNYTLYVQYQKDGPYVDDYDENEITVKSYEPLRGVAWVLDPEDYLNGLTSEDDLTIYLDDSKLSEGKNKDWHWDNGDIVFTGLTLERGSNLFEFSWTPVDEPYEPPVDDVEEKPFYMQEYAGIPAFIIIGVLAVIVIVVIVASKKR